MILQLSIGTLNAATAGSIVTAGLKANLAASADTVGGVTGESSAAYKFTFRGDTRSPDVIFNEGFVPRGDSTDLLAHALDNAHPPSAYVPTSKSLTVASDFADNVYVVRPTNGIDVNEALGPLSPYPLEQEIAIFGKVAPSDVRAVTLPKQGASVLNPNYKP